MKRAELEQRLLDLWVTTRVPFTVVNLQVLTRVPREKLERWLDELVSAERLELDSDDHGEMLWNVVGAKRSSTGPSEVGAIKRLGELKALVPRSSSAITVSGKKSVIASSALSFFLGPVGLLYAAPLKEAAPAALAWIAALAILPHLLIAPLFGVVGTVSAAFGALYAWQHNLRGGRTSVKQLMK